MKGKVIFIGAGPGDPDLITVKGRKVIEEADVIIYAGSLVNKEVLNPAYRNSPVAFMLEQDFNQVLNDFNKENK